MSEATRRLWPEQDQSIGNVHRVGFYVYCSEPHRGCSPTNRQTHPPPETWTERTALVESCSSIASDVTTLGVESWVTSVCQRSPSVVRHPPAPQCVAIHPTPKVADIQTPIVSLCRPFAPAHWHNLPVFETRSLPPSSLTWSWSVLAWWFESFSTVLRNRSEVLLRRTESEMMGRRQWPHYSRWWVGMRDVGGEAVLQRWSFRRFDVDDDCYSVGRGWKWRGTVALPSSRIRLPMCLWSAPNRFAG